MKHNRLLGLEDQAVHNYIWSLMRSRDLTIRVYVKCIISQLERLGFYVISTTVQKRRLFTEDDLRSARKDFASSAGIPLSELILSESTKRRVLAEIRFTKIILLHDRPDTTAEVVFACRNSFPALGIELWLRNRPRLPGGFVTIRSPDNQIIDSVKKELSKGRRKGEGE